MLYIAGALVTSYLNLPLEIESFSSYGYTSSVHCDSISCTDPWLFEIPLKQWSLLHMKLVGLSGFPLKVFSHIPLDLEIFNCVKL